MKQPTWQSDCGTISLYWADCLDVLPHLSGVDAVVTDPPYAEIDRDYGRFTEGEWRELIDATVAGVREMLTDSGSAVFILQPNSERVGRVRPWLWEFMAKWSRDWNMIQDAWWWNHCAPPTVHCHRNRGLMRPSMKACVWLGDENCYRDQSAVLLDAAESTKSDKRFERNNIELKYSTSGLSMRHGRALAAYRERGGVTPFNVVVCGNSNSSDSAGTHGHGAGTPMALCDWWVRYISPASGVVCDPFMGSGTTGIASVKNGRRFIGIEKEKKYFDIAVERISAELSRMPLLEAAK